MLSDDKRVVQIAGDEFIGRLLQHVLPLGSKRIRHYGLLAPATKGKRLSQAMEDAKTFMCRVAPLEIDICPHGQVGRLRLVQLLAPQRSSTPEALVQAVCRGSPCVRRVCDPVCLQLTAPWPWG